MTARTVTVTKFLNGSGQKIAIRQAANGGYEQVGVMEDPGPCSTARKVCDLICKDEVNLFLCGFLTGSILAYILMGFCPKYKRTKTGKPFYGSGKLEGMVCVPKEAITGKGTVEEKILQALLNENIRQLSKDAVIDIQDEQ